MNVAVLPKHATCKASGFDWVGEVPSHWDVERLGSMLNAVSEKNRPDLPLLSITRELGVIERDVEDQESNHNFIPDDLSGYKVLRKGQFGMNKMKAWQGSYGVSAYTGIVSPAYFIFDFAREVDPHFFNIAIRSKLYVSYFGSASDGVRVGQWDLNQSRMRQIPILLPPLSEQRTIAKFLDGKCPKIDEAVRIKEEQIALLRERRQILIQEAVTRGLNPDAPMKDSGVDWIGQIPAHWEVMPFTKYCQSIVDYRGKTPEKVDEGVLLVTAKNVRDGFIDYEVSREYIRRSQYEAVMSRGKPRRGDILFTTEAPLGNVALVDDESVALAQRIIKFRLNEHFVPEFVNCYLNSRGFQDNLATMGTGSTAMGIKASKLNQLITVMPPLEEQKAIAAHLSRVTEKTNAGIAIKEEQIAVLKEYKASLINSAVTGKIKVN